MRSIRRSSSASGNGEHAEPVRAAIFSKAYPAIGAKPAESIRFPTEQPTESLSKDVPLIYRSPHDAEPVATGTVSLPAGP
jgi:hypothetical protein